MREGRYRAPVSSWSKRRFGGKTKCEMTLFITRRASLTSGTTSTRSFCREKLLKGCCGQKIYVSCTIGPQICQRKHRNLNGSRLKLKDRYSTPMRGDCRMSERRVELKKAKGEMFVSVVTWFNRVRTYFLSHEGCLKVSSLFKRSCAFAACKDA